MGAGRHGVGRLCGKTFPKVGRTGPQGRPRLIEEFRLPEQASGLSYSSRLCNPQYLGWEGKQPEGKGECL